MQLEGMSIGLEPCPESRHGPTHRELGDCTDTLALLMETSNPSQGRLEKGEGRRKPGGHRTG